jgi:N-acetylglutamate synthase-like GNAT family acetyltransferase
MDLRSATAADGASIRSLLADASLPVGDVDLTRQAFIVVIADGGTEGCIALELFGSAALVRSLVVRHQRRGAGFGSALLERIRELAISHHVEILFLLTTTASAFFKSRGFVKVDRSVVPEEVTHSAQFTGLCPSSATCMMLKL